MKNITVLIGIIQLVTLLIQTAVIVPNEIDEYILQWNKARNVEDNTSWDPEFDCDIKKLAYEFAQKLSPGTGDKKELAYIYDALELNTTCRQVRDLGKFEHPWNKDYFTEKHDNLNNIKIFVDNTNGKLTNNGDVSQPLPNIHLGVEKCKNLIIDASYTCTVYIRNGVYRISSPIVIDSDNIKLRSYGQENVTITSNVLVKPMWKAYKVNKMDIFEGLDPIFEDIKPKENTTSVLFSGVVSNWTSCQSICTGKKNPGCYSFVYFDKTNVGFENHCYVRIDGKWNPVNRNGTVSGKLVSSHPCSFLSTQLFNILCNF